MKVFSIFAFTFALCTAANAQSNALNLTDIRNQLGLIENSVIWALINRAQYGANAAMYKTHKVHHGKHTTTEPSILQKALAATEVVQAKFRRYQPGTYEYPFTNPKVNDYAIPKLKVTSVLHDDHYVINDQIYNDYINSILPGLGLTGDDQLYDLAAAADIALLQLISRRIHYGKVVAESKWNTSSAQYTPLIKAKNTTAIEALLTDSVQETLVINRSTAKVDYFGATLNYVTSLVPSSPYSIPATAVTNLYQNYMIPLTKVIETHYLLHRLDKH